MLHTFSLILKSYISKIIYYFKPAFNKLLNEANTPMKTPDFVFRPNPNFNARTREIDGILIHSAGLNILDGNNVMYGPDFILSAGYSYHNLIEPDGTVVVTVERNNRAWHAGKSLWKGQKDLNSNFIGFCLLIDHSPLGYSEFLKAINNPVYFTDNHYESLAYLCRKAMKDYPKITIDRILTHAQVSGKDVRPDPKPDPGKGFDMNLLISMI